MSESARPGTRGAGSRREFLAGVLVDAGVVAASMLVGGRATAATPVRRRHIKLGLDNFSVRGLGWKADRLIDYAAELGTDSLFITDLEAFETLETPYLQGLAARAKDRGVQIHLGTWSICPTSNTFKPNLGTADQHLALGIRAAKDLGSPVLRVVLGNHQDRTSKGGIGARIKDTVKVLRKARGRARDANVKIAMENHAGDMRAREVVALIEAAGRDFVGANMDSGNAVWALEDPRENLEILGPYALTTSLRDSWVWESEKGATVQWTAMGAGMVDFGAYFDRFETLCPGVPVHIETISGFNREIPYLEPAFWEAYPEMTAGELARFVVMARQGGDKLAKLGRKPPGAWTPPPGKDGKDARQDARKEAEQEYQRAQIETSLRHCKEVLGLGLR
jgi:sugar phosphate isomerase/epimerase